MPRQEELNTFVAGMNLDASKTSQKVNTYSDAWNVRLVTDDGGTQGALINIKGDDQTVVFPTPEYVLGYGVIREDLYLFTTPLSNEGEGKIWKVDIYDSTTANLTLIYSNTGLNFTRDFPIGKAIGRYETATIQRLYWTDDNNTIRVINVKDPDISLLTVDNIALNSPAELEHLRLESYNQEGGSLPVGSYYYCYRLKAIDSEYTNYSQVIGPFNIYTGSEKISDNLLGLGSHFGNDTVSEPLAITSKSISLKITDIDNIRYDIIEVVAIYRTNPDIEIYDILRVFEESVDDNSIILTHTGNETNTLPLELEDISITSININKAKTIEEKDNRLFIGNVEEQTFEVSDSEFDGTLYRYNSGGSSSAQALNGTEGAVQGLYKFQANGTTLGAESLDGRVQVEFNIKKIPLDGSFGESSIEGGISRINQAAGGSVKSYWEANDPVEVTSLGDTITPGIMLQVPSNPAKTTYNRGYQRGEFYRFGIVFYDKNGASSFAKFLGDIKIPEIYDADQDMSLITSTIANNNTSSLPNLKRFYIEANVVYLKWNITLPTALEDRISAYSIVRVDRPEEDKTILGQGILNPLHDINDIGSGGIANPLDPNDVVIDGVIGYTVGDTDRISHFQEYFNVKAGTDMSSIKEPLQQEVDLTAPDFLFNEYDYKNGDFLKVVSHTSSGVYDQTFDPNGYGSSFERWNISAIRYNFASATSGFGVNDSDHDAGDDGVKNEIPLIKGTKITRGGFKYNVNVNRYYVNNSSRGVEGGSCVYLKTDNVNTNIKLIDKWRHLVNYMRPRSSQYGGNTESVLSQNTYISCNHFVRIENNNGLLISSDCYGGDTFVNWFSHTKTYGKASTGTASATRMTMAMVFPCESTINTDLRRGHTTKVNRYDIDDADNAVIANNATLIPEEYISNRLFERVNTVIKYFPKPFGIDIVSGFDTRIYYTNPKINGNKTDDWTFIKTDDFTELDNRYGSLNRLYVFKDKMYTFQDSGVSILSINPRALLSQSDDESALLLGSGNVIDDVIYISNNSGSKHRWAITNSNNFLYYFDALQKKIRVIQGGNSISLPGVDGFLRSWVNDDIIQNDNMWKSAGVTLGFDSQYNEVLISLRKITPVSRYNLYKSTEHGYTADYMKDYLRTLVYTEDAKTFSSFVSNEPYLYMQVLNKLYYPAGPNPIDGPYLWGGNSRYNTFNGLNHESKIEIINNDKSDMTKVFDTFEVQVETLDENGYQMADDGPDMINVSTDYQTSGDLSLIKNLNRSRKDRTYSIPVPRNILNVNWDESVDMNDITNQDSDRTFKERMKDKYMKSIFAFRKQSTKKMILHYIKLYYRKSSR